LKIILANISSKRSGMRSSADVLSSAYVERASRYIPVEARSFPSEKQLLMFLSSATGRTRPVVILTDARGKQLSSNEISEKITKYEDGGAQILVLAVGPPDGWSAEALDHAQELIAFGRITLPHELAAVILAEQIYRALTIRAGHPYHSGH
jgi:23S rRNA (pseudouridine1915-N3)-methyltransferase